MRSVARVVFLFSRKSSLFIGPNASPHMLLLSPFWASLRLLLLLLLQYCCCCCCLARASVFLCDDDDDDDEKELECDRQN